MSLPNFSKRYSKILGFISFEKFVEEINNIRLEELKNMPNGEVCYINEKDGLYIKAEDGIIKVLEIQGEDSIDTIT